MFPKVRIARPWRALRTGLAFASFGALALWLVVSSIPRIRRSCSDETERQLRVQAVTNRTNRRFMRLMSGLGLMRYRGHGWRADTAMSASMLVSTSIAIALLEASVVDDTGVPLVVEHVAMLLP